MGKETGFKHGDLTEKIIGAAFQVYNVLGYGFLESVYQKAMQVELMQQGIACETEAPIKVKNKGAVVGDFRADLFVENSVIVELKVTKEYCAEDEPQLLNELNATGIKTGL
jgi:GxxExxY protein